MIKMLMHKFEAQTVEFYTWFILENITINSGFVNCAFWNINQSCHIIARIITISPRNINQFSALVWFFRRCRNWRFKHWCTRLHSCKLISLFNTLPLCQLFKCSNCSNVHCQRLILFRVNISAHPQTNISSSLKTKDRERSRPALLYTSVQQHATIVYSMQ